MHKSKLPSLVTILVLTLITSLMWVGLSIYRAFTTAAPPTVPKEVLQPLDPTLDTDTINMVESSLFFNESQIPAISLATNAPTPKPIAPLATPVATPEVIPSPIPEVSPIASPTP